MATIATVRAHSAVMMADTLLIVELAEEVMPGRITDRFIVPHVDGQSDAVTVELAMLDRGMVASWLWGRQDHYLIGQFVPDGSYKEISDSRADAPQVWHA